MGSSGSSSSFETTIIDLPEVLKWDDSHWRRATFALFEEFAASNGRISAENVLAAVEEMQRCMQLGKYKNSVSGVQMADEDASVDFKQISRFPHYYPATFDDFLWYFREAVASLLISDLPPSDVTCFFVGLNYSSKQRRWGGADTVHKLSKLYNPDVVLTDDSEGTKYASVCNVTQHLKLLAQRKWKPNDTLFLFFSGHACNLPDNVDDFSAKGMDEAFCLVDNAGEITFASCLRDDDVAACIRALPKDVRVVVLLDLSNPDSSPFDLSNFVFEQEVCVLETCSENEGESAGQMIVDSVLEMVPIGPHSRRTIQCTEFGNNFLRQCTRLHRPSRRKASILGGLANALCMQAVSSSINDAGEGLCTPHDRTPSRKKERIPGSQRCFRVQGKASLRWPAPRQT